MKRWVSLFALMALALPVRAAEEQSQILFLKHWFAGPGPQWRQYVQDHRDLLDDSFFARCQERIRWDLKHGHEEDALRFEEAAQVMAALTGRELPASECASVADVPVSNDILRGLSDPEARFMYAVFLEKTRHDRDGARAAFSALEQEGFRADECRQHLEKL